MSADAEVLIAGGGVAGGAAACLLARAGVRVLLIEREAGPHDKICGEFISGEAAGDLQRIGIDLAALGAEPIARLRLVRGERAAETALPFAGFSLSRRMLDAALLAHAQECGAQVLRGHRVSLGEATSPVPGGHGNRLQVEGVGEVQAPVLFLATGKHELRGLARGIRAAPPSLVGFKMYFALAPAQQRMLAGTTEVLLFDDGYAGLQPVDGDRANLCWLSDRAELQRCGGDWHRLLDAMLSASAHLRRRLAGAQPLFERPLAISRVPYGFVHRHLPGDPAQLYRLGDQAAVIPSFAGAGISIALHSAQLAADAFVERAGAERYHRRLAADVAGPIARAGALYRFGRWPTGQRALMRLVHVWPQTLRLAASWTRIAERAQPIAAKQRSVAEEA